MRVTSGGVIKFSAKDLFLMDVDGMQKEIAKQIISDGMWWESLVEQLQSRDVERSFESSDTDDGLENVDDLIEKLHQEKEPEAIAGYITPIVDNMRFLKTARITEDGVVSAGIMYMFDWQAYRKGRIEKERL